MGHSKVQTYPVRSAIAVPGVAKVLRAQTFPFQSSLWRRRLHDLFMNEFVANGAIAVNELTHIAFVL